MTVTPRRAARDVVIQVLARGGNLALGVVVTLILARNLDTTGFGEWATLLTIVQLAATFTDLGLEPAVVARAAGDEKRESDWIGALLVLRAALAVPATLVSIVACALLADNGQMFLAGALISASLLTSVPSSLRALNQLRVRNDITMLVLTVNSVLWGLGVILVALNDGGLVAYAVAFLISGTISAALQGVLSYRQRRGPLTLGRPLWREIVVTGVSIGGAVVLISAMSRAPQLFVYELDGDEQAGLYAVASRLLDQSHFVPVALMTTLLPLLAGAIDTDPAHARAMLQRSLDILLVVSLPAVAIGYVAGPELIRIVFGEQYEEASKALPVLMAAFVLISINYPLDSMVIAMKRQVQLAKIAAVGLVTMLILNIALVTQFGFQGAAWAVFGTQAVVTGLTYRVVAKPIGMRAGQGRTLRIGGAIGGLLAVMLLTEELGAPLAVVLAAAAVTYSALLFALKAIEVDDLRTLTRRAPPAAETAS